MIGEILCEMGLHRWHYRKHGEATERVCLRSKCSATEKLQIRKDDPSIHIFQRKKSHTMKKVQEDELV